MELIQALRGMKPGEVVAFGDDGFYGKYRKQRSGSFRRVSAIKLVDHKAQDIAATFKGIGFKVIEN